MLYLIRPGSKESKLAISKFTCLSIVCGVRCYNSSLLVFINSCGYHLTLATDEFFTVILISVRRWKLEMTLYVTFYHFFMCVCTTALGGKTNFMVCSLQHNNGIVCVWIIRSDSYVLKNWDVCISLGWHHKLSSAIALDNINSHSCHPDSLWMYLAYFY